MLMEHTEILAEGITQYVGDCRDVLRTLPPESVHCCVTSPPYFGLRDYGTATWEGGDPTCDHLRPAAHGYKPFETSTLGPKADGISADNSAHADAVKRQQYKGTCSKCGAHRIDSQIGLEPTPAAFVSELVGVFREVRRVLRTDGTLWLNLGDCYCGAGYSNHTLERNGAAQRADGGKQKHGTVCLDGLKSKDLIGIPWMVAFALRDDGWFLRSDIVWNKPNPMPESVTDRPTRSHEYLFLLTKSARYFYDHEAIAEPATMKPQARLTPRDFVNGKDAGRAAHRRPDYRIRDDAEQENATRNKRSVWEVTTKPFAGAHFATFPPDLIEPCILAGCPADGTVLDPFGGAGTTALVADRLHRRAILIELNPEYAAMAERRFRSDAGMFARVETVNTTGRP
jgi:DNA modification methylase